MTELMTEATTEERYDRQIEQDYIEELNKWMESDINHFFSMMSDSVQEAADGCRVEPDGTCPHGYKSPCLLMGVI